MTAQIVEQTVGRAGGQGEHAPELPQRLALSLKRRRDDAAERQRREAAERGMAVASAWADLLCEAARVVPADVLALFYSTDAVPPGFRVLTCELTFHFRGHHPIVLRFERGSEGDQWQPALPPGTRAVHNPFGVPIGCAAGRRGPVWFRVDYGSMSVAAPDFESALDAADRGGAGGAAD